MESILSIFNPKSLLLLWKGIYFLSKTLTLNAPGTTEMVFVFHLVVHAEILNFISQNNNIGFAYLAKVVSNPSLSQHWLHLFKNFFLIKAGIIRFWMLILFPAGKCDLSVKYLSKKSSCGDLCMVTEVTQMMIFVSCLCEMFRHRGCLQGVCLWVRRRTHPS